MSPWNLRKDWKKAALVICLIFTGLILDFINGSSLRFMEIAGPECLATHVFQISLLGLLVSLFLKKEIRPKVQKWMLILIIPTILAIALENTIKDYQYEKTRNSLAEICLALTVYKKQKGKYSQNL